MSTLAATVPPAALERRATAIPWYLWCAALAVTSAYVGGYWDIAWHRSIGRDTFWTAPHMAIYACGVLAGISSAYLIFKTTFGGDRAMRDASVRIWGLRGPLGAFICAWGGVAMLASAPFDDWWHNAYGLDVKIISPPHMVLAGGFFGIEFGTVMLLLAFMNRASDRTRAALQCLFLYVGGTCLAESLLLKLEYIDRSDMHSALFFIVVSIGTPAILMAVAVASRQRWACTIVSAIYMAFGVALLWILPLVPAEPKLGPVYIPVTHLIPWEFPLLIAAPAFVVDLILQRTERWRPLARAMAAGLAFFVTFAAVQWPFANFLMTPLARNAIIGAHYMGYNTRPGTPYATFQFFARESATTFWRGMVIATLITCVMMWLGLHAGLAMKRIKR
jgi:hypothetical protein